MKAKSVGRIDPNQQITPKGVTPLVTSTGVQIGAFYNPQQKNKLNADEEFWQGILLGIEPEWSRRRIARWVVYCIFLGVVFFTAVLKGREAMQ